MSEKIVGHKTISDGKGGFIHEPLTEDEAQVLKARSDHERELRFQRMPNEQAAIKQLFDAYLRLTELGWRGISYCPKDGSSFDVIEVGSTGIHRCHYSGEWPDGSWWIEAGSD